MTAVEGRVLITGASVAQRYLDDLAAAGLSIDNPAESYPPKILTTGALLEHLDGAVAYLLGGDEVATRDVLARTQDLKIIAFLGVGYESFVDAAVAGELGIPVTNTPGTLSNSVAEFTLGHVLNERRRICAYADSVKAGNDLAQVKRYDLAGHAVGVLGLGNIGLRVAEILTQGFRADVRYYSRTRKPEQEARLGIGYVTLDELVATTETLIVMVPGTPDTEGMISRDLLEGRNRDQAPLILINTARPEVTEPSAVLWGLEMGLIESVAFDGFYPDETVETEQLKWHPRVTITPHIASLTHDARDAMSAMSVASILNVLRTGTDEHIVNR